MPTFILTAQRNYVLSGNVGSYHNVAQIKQGDKFVINMPYNVNTSTLFGNENTRSVIQCQLSKTFGDKFPIPMNSDLLQSNRNFWKITKL